MYYKWWRRKQHKICSSYQLFFLLKYFMTIEIFSLSYLFFFSLLILLLNSCESSRFYASNKNNKTITQNNKKLHLMIIAKKKEALWQQWRGRRTKKDENELYVDWLISFFLNVPLTGNENKLCCNIIYFFYLFLSFFCHPLELRSNCFIPFPSGFYLLYLQKFEKWWHFQYENTQLKKLISTHRKMMFWCLENKKVSSKK